MDSKPEGVSRYLNSRAREVCRLASSTLTLGAPRIGLQAVVNTTFGAYARYTGPDQFLVRVHEGTLIVLSTLYMRLFAHPAFLPEIGTPGLEQVPGQLWDYFDDAIDLWNAVPVNHDPGEFVIPKCLERQQYAHLLTLTSLDVVFAHEVEHITHGHISYMRAVEEGSARAPTDDERKALEYDADVSAVGLALRTSIDWFLTHEGPVHKGLSRERMVRDLALAVSMTFVIQQRLMRSDPVLRWYPPLRARQRYMIGKLIECAVARGLPENAARKHSSEGVILAEVGYHLLTGRKPHMGQLIDADDDTVNHLNGYWSTIYHEVQAFAYKPLSEPYVQGADGNWR